MNEWFDVTFCINLLSRPDRWADSLQEAVRHKLLDMRRFDAIWHETGSVGCAKSHLALMQVLVDSQYKNMLILEDDFHFVRDDWRERLKLVPPTGWDILFLGGRYMEKPIRRITDLGSANQVGRFYCTHAYAITREYAAKFLKDVKDSGVLPIPIDCWFADRAAANQFWCVRPRIVVQRPSPSDVQNWFDPHPETKQLDTFYERMV